MDRSTMELQLNGTKTRDASWLSSWCAENLAAVRTKPTVHHAQTLQDIPVCLQFMGITNVKDASWRTTCSVFSKSGSYVLSLNCSACSKGVIGPYVLAGQA
jgi:hypothetical protein